MFLKDEKKKSNTTVFICKNSLIGFLVVRGKKNNTAIVISRGRVF